MARGGWMDRAARLDLIRDLREQTRQIERPALTPAGRDEGPGRTLRDLLLGRGEGSGAVSLALAVAGQILCEGGACVVIDPTREFYPPGAACLGMLPEQTIVVRPPDFQSG